MKEKVMVLIFFDFETTGLNILGPNATDKIIQFMFLKGSSMEFYSSFVNPERPIPTETIKLNGITSMDIETYKPLSFYLPKIIDFIESKKDENVYLVAHNGDSFDKPLLLQEMQKNKIEIPDTWFFIDTLKLSRKYLPELPNHKMDTLRKHFDISTKFSHLATKDVCDLQIIYQKLAGEKKPNEIYQICRDLAKYMPFGKYKGQSLCNIPPDYFIYLLENKIITLHKNPDLYEELQNLFYSS